MTLRAKRITAAKKVSSPLSTLGVPPALGDYARSWLAARTSTMKRSAVLSYAAIFEEHVLPKHGQLRVDRTTREHVQTCPERSAAPQVRMGPHGECAAFEALARRETDGGSWWWELADRTPENQVEPDGFEPTTSALQRRRSTN